MPLEPVIALLCSLGNCVVMIMVVARFFSMNMTYFSHFAGGFHSSHTDWRLESTIQQQTNREHSLGAPAISL